MEELLKQMFCECVFENLPFIVSEIAYHITIPDELMRQHDHLVSSLDIESS